MHDNAQCIELIGDFHSTKPCDLRGPQTTTLLATLPSTFHQSESIGRHLYAIILWLTVFYPSSSLIWRSGARGLLRGAASETATKVWRRVCGLRALPSGSAMRQGQGSAHLRHIWIS